MNKPFHRLVVLLIALALPANCTDDASTPMPSNSNWSEGEQSSSDAASLADSAETRSRNRDAPRDRFGHAVIKGVIRFSGDRPDPRHLPMRGDKACHATGRTVLSQATIIAETGGVPHVFVFIKKGIDGVYTTPQSHVTLDQIGCMFVPHVFGMQTGQMLRIINSDRTLHNIHALAKRNEAFNLSQPNTGAVAVKTFTRPEIMIKFKCDVHGWMDAYCGVLPHPFFAVTDEDGMFEIPRLPAGNYVLEARHELWGALHKAITLQDGETQQVDMTYSYQQNAAASPHGDINLPATRGDAS
ncbi:MAG: carboxypeptidase regulatory-like domain-containing protein [Phycisphaerae bacterium]